MSQAGKRFDDTNQNEFLERAIQNKKNKESYEKNNKRVTFLFHPELLEAFERLRFNHQNVTGKIRGYKGNKFNEYIQKWINEIPKKQKLKYKGIGDVTDHYTLTTVFLNKKVFKRFEREIEKIQKFQDRKYGIKTEIINHILEMILIEETKMFKEQREELFEIESYPTLKALFEGEKKKWG